MRRTAWGAFSAAAYLFATASPVDAQTVAAPASGQLPAVTVNPPEARPRNRPKPPRRERAARNPSVVQPSVPVAPQVSIGVTSGSATAGPAYMQPTAASAMTIGGAEVNALPFSRPGEALEVVPGLIVTQHSGEGKANQYFLRGFNLDHGTDLSIKIDGMPVNMPTHGHGQGYADINFMIPELIQSVERPQGTVLRRRRRLRLRRRHRDRLHQQAAEEHSGDHQRHFRLSPWARGRLDGGRRGHVAGGDRRRQIQRAVGRSRQRAQDQRRAPLQPGYRYRRVHAVGDGLLQRLEFDRPGGAARDRPEHHRPLRYARSDRWRHVEPLLAIEQFCAFERVRADQGATPM